MFCPVCKYEYRRGFTHCNDCDVDLVDSLPPEEEIDHSAPTPAAALDHPTLLWSGANGGIFSALTLALDEAHIPYNKEELDARLVFTSQHGDLEIWVPVADLPQAQPILDAVLANALNSEPAASAALEAANQASALPSEDDDGAEDIGSENATRELYPEDATAEVWSGNNENMAEILKSCLAEIGVASYVAHPDPEVYSASSSASASDSATDADHPLCAIRVLPEDESRAREIVRQVTDALPPQ